MNHQFLCQQFPIVQILQGIPQAIVDISGSPDYPQITGIVRLYQSKNGVIVYADIRNLPDTETPCQKKIFGFHIHSGTACTGDEMDSFSAAMSHYNPDNCMHPYHAGDLPPLFGNHGIAVSVFLTDRFSVNEIIGKAMIIHDSSDDFITQPSGNSGTKIACGIIRRNTRT
ncbi:MAG: superoxide dismutase family protein, partial [Oscillospiraceae bacterium]|nr:superoxide dismutase family protein [Oscillospiraceae bacterium]